MATLLPDVRPAQAHLGWSMHRRLWLHPCLSGFSKPSTSGLEFAPVLSARRRVCSNASCEHGCCVTYRRPSASCCAIEDHRQSHHHCLRWAHADGLLLCLLPLQLPRQSPAKPRSRGSAWPNPPPLSRNNIPRTVHAPWGVSKHARLRWTPQRAFHKLSSVAASATAARP